MYYLGDMLSSRARIGWTTYGHTAVDVNLYGFTVRAHGRCHAIDYGPDR